jgi:hypothetical protein
MKKLPKILIILSIFSFLILPVFSFAQNIPIDLKAISGITPPVTGAVPTATIADTTEYTATISWATSTAPWPTNSPFAVDTEYRATITLTPKTGYTLTGIPADFFTVDGATVVANNANSGTVTAVFPATTAVSPTSIFTITATMQPTDNITSTSATLHAVINANKNMNDSFYNDISYIFQCVADADYQSSGFNNTSKIQSADGDFTNSTDGTESEVHAPITGLTSGTTYHCRLEVESDQTETGINLSDETTFDTSADFIPITPLINSDNTPPAQIVNTIPPTTTPTGTSYSGSGGNLIPCGTSTNKGNCDFNALMILVNNVVKFILFKLALPIAAIMFAYAGFELLTAGGDTAKMKKAKTIFINVALGLIIAAAAWLIVNTILTILGYTGTWL